jgi:hypothetical protein
MANVCLDTAIAELKGAGVYDFKIVSGGKHPQLQWQINGVLRFYALPGSASDWRTPHNVRADIRRMLKADGLLAPVAVEEKHRPRPPTLEQRVIRLERALEQLLTKAN